MVVKYCYKVFTRVCIWPPPLGIKGLHMSANTLTKRLVINADDFGYSVQRNKGIIECFKNGSVSSVSLLMNGVAVDDAVYHIKRLGIPAGMHLNLTEGLSVGKQYKSIVDEKGFFLGKMGFREALKKGAISFPELFSEIVAQIKLYYKKCGQKPTHIDGHQHVHILPGVREVFASVLQEHGITCTRIPIELDLESCSWITDDLMTFLKGVVDDAIASKDVFTKHHIRFTDGYIGLSTMGNAMTLDTIMQALSRITTYDPAACTFELMVHPGYPSEDDGGCGCGPDDFSKSADRLHEMNILNNMDLRHRIRNNGFKLVSYSNLNQTTNGCYVNDISPGL